VRTHLRSGNVVLTSEDQASEQLAAAVEAGIAERFGMDVAVVVRTREEIADVVAANPLPEGEKEPSRLFVAFLTAPLDEERVRAIDPGDYLPDRFVVRGREVYHWCPNGLSNSTLTPAFWKELGGGATATVRNWNTVTKLAAMLAE
jgi:uncharacterized protein (DUF1697 family)